MLGTRTKQIYSYGKRNKRIVNVTDERERKPLSSIFDDIEPAPRAPIASRMKKREHIAHTKSRTPSPKVVHMHKKKRLSPALSPMKKRTRAAQIFDAEVHKGELPSPKPKALIAKKPDITTASRAPLADFSLNAPGSPAITGKARGTRVPGAKETPLKPNKLFSPFVDVDIIILDDTGKTVKQERRVSRTDVDSNPINQAILKPSKRLASRRKQSVHLVDEAEKEKVVDLLKQPKRPTRRAVLTVYSDESASEDDVPLPPLKRSLKAPTSSRPSASFTSKAGPSRAMFEIVIPPSPYPIKKKPSVPPKAPSPPPVFELVPPLRYQHIPSPVARPRQLTPIRRHGLGNPFDPPSPPSPFTSTDDLDLSLNFEQLSIGASSSLSASYLPEPEIPEYLRPLLEECGQSACGPIDFSSFIETFPYDPVAQLEGSQPTDLRFRKIGEASYSEVFGIGDVVLKVIPLRDESGENAALGHIKTNVRYNEDGEEEDGPAPSDAKDVLKEVIVTHAMGEVCDGFVKLLKAYVVRGKYPEVLLRLWDEYHANKGSESVRPDTFLVSQVYTIIVLPNGGPDLEAYKFVNASKMGWRQACSLFWQVAKSLAHAEQLVSFEHRDLHVGQILVKDLPMPDALPLRARNQNTRSGAGSSRVFMDAPVHGVRATLIDLGLSRMDAGDGDGGEMVHWTPFEDEVFMGEGDYQFDVYRMMKEHNGGAWEEFKPFTNVMWLHYLVVKLLHSKRLKPPSTTRASPTPDTAAFTEKDCYNSLVDIERWLYTCVSAFAPAPKQPKGKGRRKAQAPLPPKPMSMSPACAGEIVVYAVKKGWVQATV
ncbi:hypothetical protein D9615_000598 [Tricholomella constricta]|uniref:non-specific serine/threonine protein kinase n=1 Tax=Tricholomella constricta TaxID=117010 RepID=A0A8H5MAT1_9AGAR|nr:hypothetical protein D9615_000598 [Tricholomella constricta]